MRTTALSLNGIENKLNELTDLTSDALLVCNSSHQITFVNSIFQKITGYKKKELLGIDFNGFINRIDTHPNKSFLNLDGNNINFLWGKYKKADESHIWLKWDIIRHEEQYYCSAKDLSPLYEEWNQLKFFKKVLNSSNEATIIAKKVDSEDTQSLAIVYANKAFLEFSNQEMYRVLGKSPKTFFSKNNCNGEIEQLHDAIDSWTSAKDLVIILLNFSGDKKFFEVSLDTNLDERGVADYLIIKLKDISARVNAKKELNIFKSSIDNIQVPIIVAAVNEAKKLEDLTITYVNKTTEKVAGYPKEVIIGQSMYFLKVEDTPRRVLEKLDEAYEKTVAFEQDILTRKDGQMFLVKLQGAPIFNSKGKVTHWAFIIKIIEDSYRLNTQLKNEVAERIKDLEDSNHKLESFASIVSHDLKTPLRAINNYLTLIQREMKLKLSGNELAKYKHELELLHFAQRSAVDSYELVQGVLSYSKIIKTNANFEIIDLNMELANIIVLLEEEIMTANATIDYGNLPILKCDKIQIRQLFQNLLLNALNYRGNLMCRISITHKVLNDSFFQISVKDNGIGIAEEDKEVIFELMKRGKHKSKVTGHGIGLAICKEVVKNHGGEIWVESILGKETIFHFTLKNMLHEE